MATLVEEVQMRVTDRGSDRAHAYVGGFLNGGERFQPVRLTYHSRLAAPSADLALTCVAFTFMINC